MATREGFGQGMTFPECLERRREAATVIHARLQP